MSAILYISYDGMTDNLGQSQVIPYLIGLRKKGYKIHILSCEKPQVFAHRNNHIAKLLSKNSIEWHPIPYTSKPPIFSTLYDIKQMQKEAIKIIKTNNITLLHCRSYISAQVGLYIQKKLNLPWIFDMRGFWADERVDGNIWNLKNPLYKSIYRHFKQLEKKFIANASHIISLTDAGKHEIESWHIHALHKTPITVIPCCADLEHFNYKQISEKSKLSTREELSIPQDSFVLSYLGSFGTWYMTNEMFDFFKVLHTLKSDSVFVCISPDSKEHIYKIAEKKGIPLRAIRVIKAHREDVPKYASISNWSIFFIKPVYSKKASSPTKMGELLGMGIPLICNAGVGDVETIMQHCTSGHVVKEYNTDEYKKIIDSIFTTTYINQEDLYKTSCTYYSLQEGIERYNSVYKKALK